MNQGKPNSVFEVMALIDSGVETSPAVSMAIEAAVGCVLAEDVFADADQPAFDRSAVDGFAVAVGSTAGAYAIAGEILPGDCAPQTPTAGLAVRISTGSAVPAASAIVMIEDAEVSGVHVTLKSAPEAAFVRRRGSSGQPLSGSSRVPVCCMSQPAARSCRSMSHSCPGRFATPTAR
jgi:molybdopterin molybdotransferase